MHDERDTGVAQGVEAGPDGEPGGRVESLVALCVHTEVGDHVERPPPAGQLDHIGLVVDGLEGRLAGFALDQPGDALIDHRAPEPVRDGVDELLAVQDPGDVVVIEDPLDAGQAERGSGDDHRLGPAAARPRHGGAAGLRRPLGAVGGGRVGVDLPVVIGARGVGASGGWGLAVAAARPRTARTAPG